MSSNTYASGMANAALTSGTTTRLNGSRTRPGACSPCSLTIETLRRQDTSFGTRLGVSGPDGVGCSDAGDVGGLSGERCNWPALMILLGFKDRESDFCRVGAKQGPGSLNEPDLSKGIRKRTDGNRGGMTRLWIDGQLRSQFTWTVRAPLRLVDAEEFVRTVERASWT